MTDLTPTPEDPSAAPKSPAHRARVVAAAVSAGAFVGIGIGLVATNVGDDADPSPISADGGVNQSPFGTTGQGDGTTDLDGDGRVGDPGDFGGTDSFGGGDQFVPPSGQFGDGDDFGGGDQFVPPSDQFGGSDSGATPAPFGGQTAPDTNSGGS